MNLFKKLGQTHFLVNHWEKKPLVTRSFIENAHSILEPDDLIEMAANEYFESRLIGKKDDKSWKIQHGPFELTELTKDLTEWTLINHNVNLYSKELMALQEELEFLPAWLFDDAMTTYSNKGSSVGAHIDNYNVFIIQLRGQRKWDIQLNPNKAYQEGLEVKILKEFTPDESYILGPGDLIYIPPHVAHQGTSLTDSLSLSLGFKSLEDKALVEQFAIELVNFFESENFYKTSFASAVDDPYIIDEKIIKDIKERIMKSIFNDQFLEGALLKFTSSSKRPTQESEASLDYFLLKAQNTPLYKDEFTRISAIKKTKSTYRIAVNDLDFMATQQEYLFIKSLAYMTCEDELYLADYPTFEKLFFELYKKGILFFNEDE